MSAKAQLPTFQLGDFVRKNSGSQWHGFIVGFYSTARTPEGYVVESCTESESIQIYPAHALERAPLSSDELEQSSANQRDAERYRWLRNQFCSTLLDAGGPFFLMAMLENRGAMSLDTLVDGAIALRVSN